MREDGGVADRAGGGEGGGWGGEGGLMDVEGGPGRESNYLRFICSSRVTAVFDEADGNVLVEYNTWRGGWGRPG